MAFFDRLKDLVGLDGPQPARTPAPTARATQPARTPTPALSSRLTNNPVTRGLSRTYDQINPLDSGRTWQHRTPNKTQSTSYQLTHNGISNAVGDIVKPIARLPLNLSNASANLAHRAANATPVIRAGGVGAGGRQVAQQTPQQQFKDPLTSSLTKVANPSGKLRQIAGDAVNIGVGAFAPGSSKVVEAGVSRALPSVLPKVIPRAIGAGTVGVPTGAVSNVATLLSGNDPINAQSIKKAAIQGGVFGGAGGAAIPLAGAVAGRAAPVLKQGAQKTAKAVQAADQKAFTPRVNLNDQSTLRDFSDSLVGANKLQGKALSDTIVAARQIGDKYGVDLTQGTVAERLERANSILDQVGKKNKSISQGGYVKNPLGGEGPLRLPGETPRQTPPQLPRIPQGPQVDNVGGISLQPTIAPEPQRTQLSKGMLTEQNTDRLGQPDDSIQDTRISDYDTTLYRGKNATNIKQENLDRPVFYAEDQEYAKTYGEVSSMPAKGRVLNINSANAYDSIAFRIGNIIGELAQEQKMPVAEVRDIMRKYGNNLLAGEQLSTLMRESMPEIVKQAFRKAGIDYIRIEGGQFPGTIGRIGHQTEVIQLPKPKGAKVPTRTPAKEAGIDTPYGSPQSVSDVLQTRPTSEISLARATRVELNTNRLDLTERQQKKLKDDTTELITRMSNDDVQKAAKSAGIDTRTYTPEQTRKKIAEQLNLRQDTVRLQNEADKARQAGDLDRAAALLKQSAEAGRTSRTQGTDIARQLQARKIIANELDTPQQRVFKLLDNAGVNPDEYTKRLAGIDFNDSQEVVKAYREMVPPKWGDWLDTVRYNSMLSSPLTHIVNVGSNALNVGVVAPVEKTIRGIADSIGGLFGKERQYAAGEGVAYAVGAASNLKNAASNFLDAMRTGQNTNLDLTDASTPLAIGGIKGKTYSTLSFPMKMLGASDKFFRTLAEAGEDSALSVRERAGIKLGGNRDALKETEGSYRLYQQETSPDGQGAILNTIDQVANSIQTLRSKNRAFGFVFPFVKTPTNILKQGVEFSPLGFANAITAEDKLTALTRASIGTAVFGASAAMLAAGDLTWAEPISPEEKARHRAEGKQPYSMRINGKYVNFSKLPPAVAFPFALTAAIDDAISNRKMSTGTGDAIMQGVAKWGQFLGDQSYLKQVGDTLALVKGDPEKAVQAVSNYPQQLLPFRALTGWVARLTDDSERKINTDKSYIDKQVQSLMLNYPGLRQKVGTRDYRGEVIPANNPVLNSFAPFKITDDRGANPIDVELDAAKKATEHDPLLTDSQNKQVSSLAANGITKAQSDFIKTDEYKSLSPADRKRGLEAIKKDITAVESRKYQAAHNTGMYAPDYKGEQTKLTARQSAIADGGFDISSYTSKDKGTNPDEYYKSPDAEYKAAKKEYEQNIKQNKYASPAKRIAAQQSLLKLKAGSDIPKDIRDLYSLSKKELWSYVSTDPNGKKTAEALIAYGDKLQAAGLGKSKFRTSSGGLNFSDPNTAKSSSKAASLPGEISYSGTATLASAVNRAKVRYSKSKSGAKKVALRKV